MAYQTIRDFLFKFFSFKRSLFFRFFVSYFLLLTLFLLFSFLVLLYVTNQSIDQNLRQTSLVLYRSISSPLEVYLLSRAPSYIEEAQKIAEMFPFLLAFHLYDDKGSLILSFAKGNYHPPNIDPQYQESCLIVTSPEYGKVCIKFFPLKVIFDDLPAKPILAYLRLDISRTYFEDVPRKTTFGIFLVYLVFAIFALFISFLFSSRFANPLKKLVAATKQIKQGNFDFYLHSYSGIKEIDELIESFNRMAKALKAYSDELKNSWENFRIIADFTADWEYWEDPEGNFIYISPACERITGYPTREFLKNPELMERIIHPEDLQAWIDHKQEVHKRRFPGREFEFRIVTAEGQIKWISHVCNPVYDQKGKYLGIRGSNRDITYRKELEQRVFEAQKMESIARLAGGIAYDLNNLMTAIVGQAELLKLFPASPDKVKERAEKILEISERASELAERLLDYARGREFRPKVVDLNEIVQGTVRLQETVLDGKIELSLKLKENLKPVFGDPNQLAQVVMNLVINAIEAMQNGGQLIIETKSVKLTQAVEEIPPGDYVVLRVKDTGCGMDQETISKIFEPYFSTKDFGRGLGLAAVFGIIKTHRGFIKVFSEKGKGTIFEVYLPSYKAPPENLSS